MKKSNLGSKRFTIDDKSSKTINKAADIYTDLTNQLVLISKMTLSRWNDAEGWEELEKMLPAVEKMNEDLGKLISEYNI